MNVGEAQAAIARLQAAFPQPKIPPSTVESWTRLLAQSDHELIDALVASDQMALSTRRMPAMAEWIEAMRFAKAARLADVPELDAAPGDYCTFTEFVERNPEIRQRLAKIGWYSSVLKDRAPA